jgi:hypothetical protein
VTSEARILGTFENSFAAAMIQVDDSSEVEVVVQHPDEEEVARNLVVGDWGPRAHSVLLRTILTECLGNSFQIQN